MNLQPINPLRAPLRLVCSHCGRLTPVEQLMADLDGPSFAAFYCKACQQELEKRK